MNKKCLLSILLFKCNYYNHNDDVYDLNANTILLVVLNE